MTTLNRLKHLISLGNRLAADSEMRGGLAMVDRGGFSEFRSSALSALQAQFGATHPHFTQFESQVSPPTQSRVEIGLGILRAALADVEMPPEQVVPLSGIAFESLLHPSISAAAMAHFNDQHWRDAILNSIIAVFDLLRQRTGLDLDGVALVSQALSLENPKLIITELNTESGRNEQKGMIQLL